MKGYSSYEAMRRAEAKQAAKAKAARLRKQIETDQVRLKSLGFYGGGQTGYIDSSTKSAITTFRKANDLGAGTSLNDRSRAVLHGNQAISRFSWEVKLRTERVKVNQQALTDLDFYNGAIDGVEGSKTIDAIRNFKSEYSFDTQVQKLDDFERKRLLSDQANIHLLRNASEDGVAAVRVTADGSGYKMHTSHDYYYGAQDAVQLQDVVEKALKKSHLNKVYVDLSGLTESRVKSLEATLKMSPKPAVTIIKTDRSMELLFSRSVQLDQISDPVKVSGWSPLSLFSKRWRAIVSFKPLNGNPVNETLHITGKTEELTSTFVSKLRGTFSNKSRERQTLGGALNRVREEIKKSRDIKSDADFELEMKNETKRIQLLHLFPVASDKFIAQCISEDEKNSDESVLNDHNVG